MRFSDLKPTVLIGNRPVDPRVVQGIAGGPTGMFYLHLKLGLHDVNTLRHQRKVTFKIPMGEGDSSY